MVLLVCLAAVSCRSATEPVPIAIPKGFVAVTKEQHQLAAKVKTLTRGMSQADVKARLGTPAEESAEQLFYNLREDNLHGGHYVTARLVFDRRGLAKVELGFGHLSLAPAAGDR